MYAFIKSLPRQQLFLSAVPALLIAMFIAETFYKFRSFTLECLAFLVTWFVVDWVATVVYQRLAPASPAQPRP